MAALAAITYRFGFFSFDFSEDYSKYSGKWFSLKISTQRILNHSIQASTLSVAIPFLFLAIALKTSNSFWRVVGKIQGSSVLTQTAIRPVRIQ